eukprot:scaffold1181_cov112-Isochrysis_galbana.AAC.5
MVQVCEIHPDGTEEIVPSMAVDTADSGSDSALRPDAQLSNSGKPFVRLRLLPSSSRERICPMLNLEPVVPRPLLLQLQPTYPLAKVPPHQAFFSGLQWRRGASDVDDIMDMENDDAVSSSPPATAGSASTRAGDPSEDSPGEDLTPSPPAEGRQSIRRKLRVGAPFEPAAAQEKQGQAGDPAGTGAVDPTRSTADVDRLASKFNEWSTDWELSPPKRIRTAPPLEETATGATGAGPSGDPGASAGACGQEPPKTVFPGACARDGAGGAEAGGAAGYQDAADGAEAAGLSACPAAPLGAPPAPPTSPTRPSSGGDGLEQRLRQVSGLVLRSRSKRKAVDEAPIDEMTHLHLGAPRPDAAGGGPGGGRVAADRVVQRRKKQAPAAGAGLPTGPCGAEAGGGRAACPIPEGGHAAAAAVRAGG